MALAFPVVIGAVFGIVYFSSQATKKASTNAGNQKFSYVITDQTGLINKKLVTKLGASETKDQQAAISAVKSGKIDAYFIYPKDLATSQVQIYAKDAGLFDDGKYQDVASLILQDSVAPTVNPQTTAILKDTVSYNSTIYRNGVQFDGIKALVAPGIFLVLFYILIAVFGNQMLTNTTEEKENRVIEIILTTIKARTLIIGKILSLLVLALIQVVVILVPVIIVYSLWHNQLSLPNLDLSNIPLDPIHIGVAVILFILSFLMFTGLLIAIGSAVPTAKDASGFFGIVVLLLLGPMYAISLFFSSPDSGIVRFLTFFPFTAPVPLMVRNAVGNLSVADTIIGITILAISAVVALAVAIRIFQYGALEYSRRISLKSIFEKR
jgi:ABC-2 type transport system permease protein